jgi:hypothetical protein
VIIGVEEGSILYTTAGHSVYTNGIEYAVGVWNLEAVVCVITSED